MPYVRASTENPVGWRPWQSRLGNLGFYRRFNFVLPTSSLSGLGVLMPNYAGFARGRDWVSGGLTPWSRDPRDAPVPRVYVPSELTKSRQSLGALPQRTDSANGASSYRIDPETGLYRYFPIAPPTSRGVFTQNTFQPPASAVSPTGAPIASSGGVTITLPGGQTISVGTAPADPWARFQAWLDKDSVISGVANKWLGLGFVGLMLLRGGRG